MTWWCEDCERRTTITKAGRCGTCNSDAVMPQDPEEPLTARKAYLKLLDALDTRLPDTELLGVGTAEQLTKRRMSVLNATAQAMIEESAGELSRHEPRMPQGDQIPTYEQITHCACGLRYSTAMPAAHQRHTDKVLASIILTIRDGVLNARQVNWHDVKSEADSWHNVTSEPMRN